MMYELKQFSWTLDHEAFAKGKWCYDTPGTVNNEQVLFWIRLINVNLRFSIFLYFIIFFCFFKNFLDEFLTNGVLLFYNICSHILSFLNEISRNINI